MAAGPPSTNIKRRRLTERRWSISAGAELHLLCFRDYIGAGAELRGHDRHPGYKAREQLRVLRFRCNRLIVLGTEIKGFAANVLNKLRNV